MDLSVEIGGIRFEHPISLMAGTCRMLDQVRKVTASASSGVWHGSTTLPMRLPNPGDVLAVLPFGTINCVGMGNPGRDYYLEHGREMREVAERAGKPFIMSIAGLEVNDWAPLVQMAIEVGAHGIELNFGCPNVLKFYQDFGDPQGGGFKVIPSFSSMAMDKIFSTLDNLRERARYGNFLLSIKFSPFSDHEKMREAARVVVKQREDYAFNISAITTTNTFPSCLAYKEDGTTCLTPADGLGGGGGKLLKPVGLGQVYQFRKLLPPEVRIIGVGGVSTGRDVIDYRRAGADLVGVASEYLAKGEDGNVPGRILSEYIDLL